MKLNYCDDFNCIIQNCCTFVTDFIYSNTKIMRKFFLFLLILPVAVLTWAQDASDNFIIEKDNAWIRGPAN